MTDVIKNGTVVGNAANNIRIASQRRSLVQGLQQELDVLDQKHLLRQRRTVETPSAPSLRTPNWQKPCRKVHPCMAWVAVLRT